MRYPTKRVIQPLLLATVTAKVLMGKQGINVGKPRLMSPATP